MAPSGAASCPKRVSWRGAASSEPQLHEVRRVRCAAGVSSLAMRLLPCLVAAPRGDARGLLGRLREPSRSMVMTPGKGGPARVGLAEREVGRGASCGSAASGASWEVLVLGAGLGGFVLGFGAWNAKVGWFFCGAAPENAGNALVWPGREKAAVAAAAASAAVGVAVAAPACGLGLDPQVEEVGRWGTGPTTPGRALRRILSWAVTVMMDGTVVGSAASLVGQALKKWKTRPSWGRLHPGAVSMTAVKQPGLLWHLSCVLVSWQAM